MRIPPPALTLPAISTVSSPTNLSSMGSSFMKSALQGEGFLDLVTHVGKSTRDTLHTAEEASRKAALGDADPQQVTFEVLKAKAAIHQFTTLVNTSLQSLQEVLRMGV
jgi:flagellar hook-basal body complex protein FliE